jgi:hypothetical protein
MHVFTNSLKGAALVLVISTRPDIGADLSEHRKRTADGRASELPDYFDHAEAFVPLCKLNEPGSFKAPKGATVYTLGGRRVELTPEGCFAPGEPGFLDFPEREGAASGESLDARVERRAREIADERSRALETRLAALEAGRPAPAPAPRGAPSRGAPGGE